MKSLSRVVWSEGMYLGPHHFQTQSRYFEDSIHFAVEHSWFEPWGLISCKLDENAIRNGRVALLSAHGIFEDGMVFDMPECDPLPASREIREQLSPLSQDAVISLAVPRRAPGEMNCDLEGNGAEVRYRAVSRAVADVNNGSDQKEIKLGEKNIRLVLDSEIAESLLTIPIARVQRDGSGHLVFDPNFIPPCTKLTASQPLLALVRRLLEILEEKQKFFSRGKNTAGVFQAGARQLDVANFWFLHTLNGGIATLRHLYASKRGHPEELFREMSRLAGELCTFGFDSHPGTLPLYDHRKLQECFEQLSEHIRNHLEVLIPTNTVQIGLAPDGSNFYSGQIHDPRCLGRCKWVLGVRSAGSEARLITRVPEVVKVCSREWISKLVARALPGLYLKHLQAPPSAISPKVEFQYFSVERSGPCWNHIADTRQVGVYVPDDLVSPELELLVVLETT
ncbi:MAG TPA: type VI secretion system baseplate subunit TssK [Terriglobales bacterium]|nr:type VI secretion system baseplate subunit TssK [Terriglobales bacterium]